MMCRGDQLADYHGEPNWGSAPPKGLETHSMECASTLAPATDCEAFDNQMDRLNCGIFAGCRVAVTTGSLAGVTGRAIAQDSDHRWLVELPGQGAYLRVAADSLAAR